MSANNVIVLSRLILHFIFRLSYHGVYYNYCIKIESCLHSIISFLTDYTQCMCKYISCAMCYLLLCMSFFIFYFLFFVFFNIIFIIWLYSTFRSLYYIVQGDNRMFHPNIATLLLISRSPLCYSLNHSWSSV